MKDREPIYGLDVIRFAAAMAVVGWHVAYRFFDPHADHISVFVAGLPTGDGPLRLITQWGWIGVQIFFVISGLVIAYSAEGATPRRFALGRFGRLVPGILICATLILAIDLLFWHQPFVVLAKEAAKTVILWPAGGWVAPQFWTLPVEIAFYTIVWAMIAAGKINRLDWLALALVGMSALHLGLSAFDLDHMGGQIVNVLLLKHGMYFAMGIALASIDRRGLSVGRVFVILAAATLAMLEIPLSVHTYGVYSAAAPHRWIIPYAIWVGGVTLIMLSLGWKSEIARFVRVARMSGTLRTIGLATYPLYLIHIHVAGVVVTLTRAAGAAVIPALLLGVTTSVIAAAVIAVLIEPRVRRLLLAPFGGPSREKEATEVRPSLPGLGDFSTEQG